MTPAEQRAAVLGLVEGHVENLNLRRHMLACEAVMRALAVRLDGDPDIWGLAGLGHDVDAESTAHDFAMHGVAAARLLAEAGVPDEVGHAVMAHNFDTGVRAESPLDIALIAADQTTGLITAATLVRHDRSLTGVKLKSVRKRYRETAFARGVDRGSIARCDELGLELDEFLAIALGAMQGTASELGLAGT